MIEKYFLSTEEWTQIQGNELDTSLSQNQIQLSWPVMVYLELRINIRNLHNIIFASPSKSRIRNLQSIGRASENLKIKILQLCMILQMISLMEKP